MRPIMSATSSKTQVNSPAIPLSGIRFQRTIEVGYECIIQRKLCHTHDDTAGDRYAAINLGELGPKRICIWSGRL